ncbi:peptide ABC transporter ATP-binding protein [Halorhabdus salina]|uniref:peptide ABC transporter ATP-binding protein n=1 Tax=Halorhabdus salina TaxID=2750670 RepID=UPI0015EF192A|nr:peptide ABC transporter ATP-binding protein [Halorhabdus salina]
MAASGDLVSTIEGLARSGPDLSVTANLSVTVENIDLAISTVDDRIRVQVPSVRAGFRLLRREHERLPVLSGVLSEAGLTAEIRVGNAVIAVAGTDAAPDRLSRLLSLGTVEVRLRGLVPAALRLQ